MNTLSTIRGTLLIHIWWHENRIRHLKSRTSLTSIWSLTNATWATRRHWLLLLVTRLSSWNLILRRWRGSNSTRTTHVGCILLILTSISTSSMFILLVLRLHILIGTRRSSLMHLIHHELTLRYIQVVWWRWWYWRYLSIRNTSKWTTDFLLSISAPWASLVIGITHGSLHTTLAIPIAKGTSTSATNIIVVVPLWENRGALFACSSAVLHEWCWTWLKWNCVHNSITWLWRLLLHGLARTSTTVRRRSLLVVLRPLISTSLVTALGSSWILLRSWSTTVRSSGCGNHLRWLRVIASGLEGGTLNSWALNLWSIDSIRLRWARSRCVQMDHLLYSLTTAALIYRRSLRGRTRSCTSYCLSLSLLTTGLRGIVEATIFSIVPLTFLWETNRFRPSLLGLTSGIWLLRGWTIARCNLRLLLLIVSLLSATIVRSWRSVLLRGSISICWFLMRDRWPVCSNLKACTILWWPLSLDSSWGNRHRILLSSHADGLMSLTLSSIVVLATWSSANGCV